MGLDVTTSSFQVFRFSPHLYVEVTHYVTLRHRKVVTLVRHVL